MKSTYKKSNRVSIIYQERHSIGLADIRLERKKNAIVKVLDKLGKQYHENMDKQLSILSYDHITNQIVSHGVYEIGDLSLVFNWLQGLNVELSDGVALDIGANIGNHSLYFSRFFKHVYSFEPYKRAFELLRLNSELVSNMTCFNFGVSSENCVTKLFIPASNIGGAKVSNEKIDSTEFSEVELKCLDDCFQSDIPIHLLKIDVEGHEYDAIKGAKNLISKHMPLIMFEQLKHEINDGTSICIEWLKGVGYSKFACIEDRQLPLRKFTPKMVREPLKNMIEIIRGRKRLIITKEKFHRKDYPFILAIPDRFFLTE